MGTKHIFVEHVLSVLLPSVILRLLLSPSLNNAIRLGVHSVLNLLSKSELSITSFPLVHQLAANPLLTESQGRRLSNSNQNS